MTSNVNRRLPRPCTLCLRARNLRTRSKTYWSTLRYALPRDRKSGRVDFERGIPVYMMGIDGTWRRDCMMIDASQTGARLLIEGSLEGLDLKEFFLLLSSTGLAFRRCILVRVDGDQIGGQFLARDKVKKQLVKPQPADH